MRVSFIESQPEPHIYDMTYGIHHSPQFPLNQSIALVPKGRADSVEETKKNQSHSIPRTTKIWSQCNIRQHALTLVSAALFALVLQQSHLIVLWAMNASDQNSGASIIVQKQKRWFFGAVREWTQVFSNVYIYIYFCKIKQIIFANIYIYMILWNMSAAPNVVQSYIYIWPFWYHMWLKFDRRFG